MQTMKETARMFLLSILLVITGIGILFFFRITSGAVTFHQVMAAGVFMGAGGGFFIGRMASNKKN